MTILGGEWERVSAWMGACVRMETTTLPSAIKALETSQPLGCAASGFLLNQMLVLSTGSGCRGAVGEAGRAAGPKRGVCFADRK